MFTFLKIEGPVIYNFPILVLGLIFDRGGTHLVDFFISSMILVLAVREIFVVSLEKGGGGGVLHPPSLGKALYTIYSKEYIYI